MESSMMMGVYQQVQGQILLFSGMFQVDSTQNEPRQ